MHPRVRWSLGTLLVLGVLLLPLGAVAGDAEGEGAGDGLGYHVAPYAWGLHGPRGLTLDAEGRLVVAELGTGEMDGRILRLTDLDGNGMADNGAEIKALINSAPSGYTFLGPDEPELTGPSDVAFGADGTLYFVTGIFFQVDPTTRNFMALWSTAAPNNSTNPLRVANPYAWFYDHESAANPDGDIVDSNPFSLVSGPDGEVYVNDAGANATLKVAADGTISTYAIYAPVEVPPQWGFPVTHAVPTGIAWGPDGALYVSQLTGFPFTEGASNVYRLSDDNDDGDAMDDGEMTVYAEGLTTSTAIAFDHDGNLLATEFRGFLHGGAPNTGRVVMWMDDEWHTVADGLVTPTGLAVGNDGTIYVTMEFAGAIMAIRP